MRPEGWENPHDFKYKPWVNSAVDVAEGKAYEAPASYDAMLERLKREGIRFSGENLTRITHIDDEHPVIVISSGYLVFIPEDSPETPE